MSHETNSFFRTEYKHHPNMTSQDDMCFGKTIIFNISGTGVRIGDAFGTSRV